MFLVITLLFIVLISLMIYLFFAPFYIEINSVNNLYRIRLHYLASVSLRIEDEQPFIETSFLGSKGRRNLFNPQPIRRKINPVKRRKSKTTRQVPYNRILNTLTSFKINKCCVSLDMGDMQLNGMLYPAFAWLSWYSGKHIEINFIGRNEVVIEIQNSIARMSWAFISSKL